MTNNRGRIAIATGAVLGLAVLVGQPALANGDSDRAAPQVTSAQIKNGTIKPKDVNSKIRASLARANSALQSIGLGSINSTHLADNSVGSSELADNAVGSAEVAADSLTAADLANNSVGDNELASDSVSGNEVEDGTLDSDDISANNGVTAIDLPSIAANACDDFVILSGNGSLTGDLILVTPGSGFVNGLTVTPRPQSGLGGNILVAVCNTTGGAINPGATDFAWAVIEN